MSDSTTPTSATPAEEPKRSTITRTPTIGSTKIDSYGYDAGRRVLAVRFKGFKDGLPGPAVYEYPNVEPSTMEALGAAESKGNFINSTFVKTKYPFEKFAA